MNTKIIVLALLLVASLENADARKKWLKCLGCLAACGINLSKADPSACACLVDSCHRI